ncbi:MAG: protein-export chaperone SecB, partial [Lachnospiraceae bacterium]
VIELLCTDYNKKATFIHYYLSNAVLESCIARVQDADVYRITLILKGNKPEEYIFEISLTGYFSIETDDTIDDKLKNALVTKNTVAILMPYLRSELSLLTAQPGMECVVLPAFNINKVLEGKLNRD